MPSPPASVETRKRTRPSLKASAADARSPVIVRGRPAASSTPSIRLSPLMNVTQPAPNSRCSADIISACVALYSVKSSTERAVYRVRISSTTRAILVSETTASAAATSSWSRSSSPTVRRRSESDWTICSSRVFRASSSSASASRSDRPRRVGALGDRSGSLKPR